MPWRCQTETAVLVVYELLYHLQNMEWRERCHKFMWNGSLAIGEVKANDLQVSSVFPCLADQVGDHSCMLYTAWHARNSSSLHHGINIGIPQEVLGHPASKNLEKDVAFHTEQGDGAELCDVTRILLF